MARNFSVPEGSRNEGHDFTPPQQRDGHAPAPPRLVDPRKFLGAIRNRLNREHPTPPDAPRNDPPKLGGLIVPAPRGGADDVEQRPVDNPSVPPDDPTTPDKEEPT